MGFTIAIIADNALNINGIRILYCTGFKAVPFSTAYIPPLLSGE